MLFISNSEFFDSSGNTYFSANVYLNSDLIMKIPYQYGYSEHCRQVFTKAACEHFGIENSNYALRELLSKNGITLSVQTKDVKKRDLSNSSFQDFSAFTKPENLALYAAHRMREGIALKHPVMENVFADWLTPDAIGVTYADGSNELLPFSAFDWF
jgi:hypothetical protein